MQYLILTCLCLVALRANATVLGDLAASMHAGEWRTLNTVGFDSGKIMVPFDQGCSLGDYVTQYAENATWDPVYKRFMFYGATHGYCYAQRFLIYSDSTNTWQVGPLYPGSCSGTSGCFSHGYDHSTVNPANGDFYYREYGAGGIFKYSAPSGPWSTLPSPPENIVRIFGDCCGGFEFYPELGGPVLFPGSGGMQIGILDIGTNQWSQLAHDLYEPGTGSFIEYNPVYKTMLFGEGTNLFKLDSAGQITRLNTPPIYLGVTSSVLSADPVSGKFLVLSASGFYEYDIVADAWQLLSTPVPAALAGAYGYGDGLVETEVSTYGVIMYVKYPSPAVYIYKHTESGAGIADGKCVSFAQPGIQAFPNPFHSGASLRIRSPFSGPAAVQMKIFDVSGRMLNDLTGTARAGEYAWNAANRCSGIYIVKAAQGNREVSARLLLQK